MKTIGKHIWLSSLRRISRGEELTTIIVMTRREFVLPADAARRSAAVTLNRADPRKLPREEN